MKCQFQGDLKPSSPEEILEPDMNLLKFKEPVNTGGLHQCWMGYLVLIVSKLPVLV
jgi:hypothetical protein